MFVHWYVAITDLPTLVQRDGIGAAAAVARLRSIRPIVSPNIGFRAQLLAFEETLEAQRAAAGLPPILQPTRELMRALPPWPAELAAEALAARAALDIARGREPSQEAREAMEQCFRNSWRYQLPGALAAACL